MYLTTYFNFMGFDFIAEIEYTVTYWGCPAKTYGPPENCYPAEAPEYDIESIGIALDEPGIDSSWHEATGALFDSLADHFAPAIETAIAEYEPEPTEGDWWDD